LLKQSLDVGGGKRPAGIVRFNEGAQSLYLLIVGPAMRRRRRSLRPKYCRQSPSHRLMVKRAGRGGGERGRGGRAPAAPPSPELHPKTPPGEPAEPAVQAEAAASDTSTLTLEKRNRPHGQTAEVVSEESPPPQSVEPQPARRPPSASSRARIPRSSCGRRTTLSVHFRLAGACRNGRAGRCRDQRRTWHEVAERFELDPDGKVGKRLAGEASWSGETVPWPLDDGRERLATDLSAIAVLDRERRFTGFRGFGTIHADRRSAGTTIIEFEAQAEAAPALEPSATPPAEPASASRPKCQPQPKCNGLPPRPSQRPRARLR